MSETVIEVENLSKHYRLGTVGTGTLVHDVNRWWHKMLGKEDPYLLISETNDRTQKGVTDYVWSLKDINLSIKRGEVMGIVGRNGAGKSTLLKILSRTTAPTTGHVKIKGRVASLLEVGTGFHPELTGRENVFLNGAILGMTKKEIKRKFDEIVDFSGVERYIDTPVKRYSSGMYVRLAFAVAANLESEILIIDEVLAVGDAEFQQKCLGKMDEVSKAHGRTVLFVSHNMTAINSLCPKSIYLKNGRIAEIGQTSTVLNTYLTTESEIISERSWTGSHPGDDVACLLRARIVDRSSQVIEVARIDQEIGIEFVYEVLRGGFLPIPNIHVYNIKGDHVFASIEASKTELAQPGLFKATMWIPGNFLNDGRYIIGVAASTLIPQIVHFYEKESLVFDIVENMEERHTDYRGSMPGIVRPRLLWQTAKIK